MSRWAPHIFRQAAESAGLPDQQTRDIADHYRHAYQQGIAPVVSLKHLAVSSQVEYAHLRGRCARREFVRVGHEKSRPYKTFAIKKRSGGKRVISVPAEDLLRVQRWIHHNILFQQECHYRAFAYQPKKSIVDCAAVHSGCRWLIKLDLSRFFESVTERQVYKVFRALGYWPLISFEMARLCTRVDKKSKKHKTGPKWESARKTPCIEAYSHPYVGYLPQGAPTSPMLSNLVAFDLDKDLDALAESVGAQYSRYSDDIHFSVASEGFSKCAAVDVVHRASGLIAKHGFSLNQSKTTIAGPGHRRLVLGMLVDSERPRLCRQFRRRLEWHYRHCVTDPAHHAAVKGFDSVLGLKNHVNGLLAFAKGVDLEFVRDLEQTLIQWPV